MTRVGTVEKHPLIDEINRHLIEAKLSQAEIARRYGVTYDAIRWYYRTRLQPTLKQLQEKAKISRENIALDSIEVLNEIIARWPEVVDLATVSQILKAIELRARLTGEEAAPPRIEIIWGRGLKEKKKEEEQEKQVEAEARTPNQES